VLDAPTASLLLTHLRRVSRSHHDPFVSIGRLTAVEDELLQALAHGRSPDQVAADRQVTERLVRLHLGHAVAKLHRHTLAATTQTATPVPARQVTAVRR